jgi:two-component system, OmpR family, KDP operon response regulator KdpE
VTHVLVVDDDAHILRTLRIHLAGHGYSVATAETGQDAIRIAASDRPDLVVLDLGLPDIDGTAVISALRRDSTVPIIVLSARTDAPDKVDALDTGADDYVTKPFGIAELLARMRAAVRRGALTPDTASRGEDAVVTTPAFTVDLAAKKVCRDGVELRLTRPSGRSWRSSSGTGARW